MKRLIFAAAAIAVIAGPPAYAQTSAKSATAAINKGVKADDKFVKNATMGNMAEIAMGNVALQRSQNPAIRQHAQTMIADHETAQQQLEQTVGGSVSRELDSKHHKMVDKLSRAKAEAFDREYVNAQIKAHDEAISLHEKAAKGGSADSISIKQLANAMLPKLHEHRAMTLNLAQQVGVTRPSS